MEIRVQAIHFDMSESLNDFVVKKAQRLARHYDTITNMDFNLRLVKPETSCLSTNLWHRKPPTPSRKLPTWLSKP